MTVLGSGRSAAAYRQGHCTRSDSSIGAMGPGRWKLYPLGLRQGPRFNSHCVHPTVFLEEASDPEMYHGTYSRHRCRIMGTA